MAKVFSPKPQQLSSKRMSQLPIQHQNINIITCIAQKCPLIKEEDTTDAITAHALGRNVVSE